MKFLALCSIFLFLFIPGERVEKVENISGKFGCVTKMEVIIENNKTVITKDNKRFDNILDTLKRITEHAHDMPAFGVSLDNLTKEEMKKGTWLELKFDNTYEYNYMPFDSLLIKIEKDIYGFNLIRGNNGIYEGRCFYLSLNGSMNDLYEIMKTI